MLYLLDTNHVTEFGYSSEPGFRLLRRIDEAKAECVTSIITVEEDLQGWLARLNKVRHTDLQIEVYHRLEERIQFFHRWVVLQLDRESLAQFHAFRKQGYGRIGTQDLKIACIALAHDATVLTRNVADFQQIPGLRVENWLD
ncbi:MAG: PIN domain-containing protein [Verrucomicrobiaceae bacterium]|nr:PIN domain-containing protein [Verrucomicrobiaceae bacterium]